MADDDDEKLEQVTIVYIVNLSSSIKELLATNMYRHSFNLYKHVETRKHAIELFLAVR